MRLGARARTHLVPPPFPVDVTNSTVAAWATRPTVSPELHGRLAEVVLGFRKTTLQSRDPGIEREQVGGIVIGVVCFIVLFSVLCFCCRGRRYSSDSELSGGSWYGSRPAPPLAQSPPAPPPAQTIYSRPIRHPRPLSSVVDGVGENWYGYVPEAAIPASLPLQSHAEPPPQHSSRKHAHAAAWGRRPKPPRQDILQVHPQPEENEPAQQSPIPAKPRRTYVVAAQQRTQNSFIPSIADTAYKGAKLKEAVKKKGQSYVVGETQEGTRRAIGFTRPKKPKNLILDREDPNVFSD